MSVNVTVTAPVRIIATGSVGTGIDVSVAAVSALTVDVQSVARDSALVYYGTGDPPDPAGIPDGAIYIKYEV